MRKEEPEKRIAWGWWAFGLLVTSTVWVPMGKALIVSTLEAMGFGVGW